MKLNKNTKTLVALFTGLTLSTTLIACAPQKKEAPKNENVESVSQIKNDNLNQETVKDNKSELKETQIINDDKTFNQQYFDDLKEILNEIKNCTEDKWNSEKVVELRNKAKQKFRELVDFIFNGKEINGMTFSELKDEEKELLMSEFSKLDSYIDDYIPDYKERLKNWFAEKGPTVKEWLVDRGADLKEIWTDYKTEVEEEYQNRQMSKQK